MNLFWGFCWAIVTTTVAQEVYGNKERCVPLNHEEAGQGDRFSSHAYVGNKTTVAQFSHLAQRGILG